MAEKDTPNKTLGGKGGDHDLAEERMEDWYQEAFAGAPVAATTAATHHPNNVLMKPPCSARRS